MDGRTFYVEIDGIEYKDALLPIDISMDTFVNEDGKEIGRVPNKGFREQKKDKPAKDETTTDLEVKLQLDKPQAGKDEEVQFTITAKNNGASKGTGVYVEDVIPNGFAFISATPSKGTWANDEWTIGDLDVNQQETLVIKAKVLETGNYTNNIKINSSVYDRFPTNNSMKTGNRVLLIKTTETKFDSEAPHAGITKKEANATEEFITNNLAHPENFTADCIAYRNTVEIPHRVSTRQAMVDIVEEDDGGKDPEKDSNNREFGGNILDDGTVVRATPGPVSKLGVDKTAVIQLGGVGQKFHSHPSGYKYESSKKENQVWGSVETKTDSWNNAPSYRGGDIENISENKTAFVFARRDKTVYVYGSKGVLATMPHKYFVNFKK